MTDVLTELERPDFRDRVKTLWGIDVDSLCRSALIEGSPERSLSRAVFQDRAGNRFLMEKFSKAKRGHRGQVAGVLAFLNQRGLGEALAPEAALDGTFLPLIGADCFQITRYLDSAGIERPGWLSSPGTGGEMAQFLIDMHRAAQGISENFSFSPFSIKDYIYKLFRDMDRRHPMVLKRYRPVLDFLETGFMAAHDSLPSGFCHGDFHPLNVIWHIQGSRGRVIRDGGSGSRRIKAVIDWEFTGMKPDCYDAANLVGCAGIEHPEGLAMPMVTTFLSTLKTAGIISPVSLKWFPEYVLALRFAWLSEWLRKDDIEMLETELAFMDILIHNMSDLKDIWGLINEL